MSTIQTKKKELINVIMAKIVKNETILFSFGCGHGKDEIIGIGLDIYGSGKPEILVIGNTQTRQTMSITGNIMVDHKNLIHMFESFPQTLEMTTIPIDLLDDYF